MPDCRPHRLDLDQIGKERSTPMTLVDELSASPLFEGLASDHLESLAVIAELQTLEEGAALFAEGDDAAGMYVVGAGKVKVFHLSPDGKEQILHVFGPGEPVGEAPMFAGERFPAHAETMTPARLVYLPRQGVLDVLMAHPPVALAMLAVMARRLRRFAAHIENLSLKDAPARLASYLLYEADLQEGVDVVALDMTKGQLAAFLGSTPETLSRVLGRLVREDLVAATGYRDYRIVDRAGLEAIASGMVRLR